MKVFCIPMEEPYYPSMSSQEPPQEDLCRVGTEMINSAMDRSSVNVPHY